MVVSIPSEMSRRNRAGDFSSREAETNVMCGYLVDTQVYRTITDSVRDLLLSYPLKPYPIAFIGMKIMSGMVRQDMFYSDRNSIISKFIN